MATPPELQSWLVSLLVKGVTARGAVMEMRGIAQVSLLWCRSQPGRTRLRLWPKPMRKDLTGWLQSHCAPKERVAKSASKGLRELCLSETKRSCAHRARGLGEEKPRDPASTRPMGRSR